MLIYQKWITRDDLRANPSILYVFGDNARRYGLGGQAKEMRGEPNAIGVATLEAPGLFWADAGAERQNAIVDGDMEIVETALRVGGIVVWPLDGIETGFADLERRSPLTWAHLQRKVDALKIYACIYPAPLYGRQITPTENTQ